jgi:hypothetical protein
MGQLRMSAENIFWEGAEPRLETKAQRVSLAQVWSGESRSSLVSWRRELSSRVNRQACQSRPVNTLATCS